MKKQYTRKQIREAIEYWKNVLDGMPKCRRLIPYRLTDTIFETCQANAGDFGPVNPDIVYSSNSMRSLMENEHVEYMSEAEMKTYPAAKLTLALCRAVSGILGRPIAVHTLKGIRPQFISSTGKTDALNCTNAAHNAVSCRLSYFDVADDFDDTKDIPGNAVYDFKSDFDGEKLKSNLGELVKAAHWCGYNYVCSRCMSGIFQISFEPLYNETNLNLGDKLYHVAPSILDGKINRNGLIPKSKSLIGSTRLEHPDRVYFFTKYDFSMMKSFARQIRDKFVAYDATTRIKRKISEFSVFEIDRSKMKNYNLYRDSLFDNVDPKKPIAVYTYSNIPPSAIRKIKTFSLSLDM